MKNETRERKGFILIELAAIVVLLTILVAATVPNFLEANVNSKIARAKAMVVRP